MRADRILGALALVLGIAIFIATSNFPGAAANRPGPAFLPRILALLFAVCGIILLFSKGGRTEESQSGNPDGAAGENPGSWTDIAFVSGALILYMFAAEITGFLIAAAALTYAVFFRLRNGVLTSAIAAVVLAVGTYVLFGTVLGVMLPRGWLGW